MTVTLELFRILLLQRFQVQTIWVENDRGWLLLTSLASLLSWASCWSCCDWTSDRRCSSTSRNWTTSKHHLHTRWKVLPPAQPCHTIWQYCRQSVRCTWPGGRVPYFSAISKPVTRSWDFTPRPQPGFCPWTLLGNLRPQTMQPKVESNLRNEMNKKQSKYTTALKHTLR